MAKFKASFNVEHITKGKGVVVEVKDQVYGVIVQFNNREDGILDSFTEDGRFDETEPPTLRLAGRPFNIGDKVVIGGEKGKVNNNSHQNTLTPVSVFMDSGKEHIYITHDGRAWPGTPIIAEHDWEEESHDSDAIEYRERNKGVDISPGFAKDWPIEDVTVSPEEVRHIAELREQAEVEAAFEKWQKGKDSDMPKYIKMALALEGIEVDLKTADLIREIIHAVGAAGGDYTIDNSCEIRQSIEEKYEKA